MYDIGIIGGGPGGYVAAIRAAKLGAKVVLFDDGTVGGTCLNRGCIPTKALLKSARMYQEMKEAEEYGIQASAVTVDFPAVMKRKDDIVRQLTSGVAGLLKKNGVTLIRERAVAGNRNTIHAGGESYAVKNVILATGSVPARPSIPGIEYAHDSDYVLTLEQLPDSMVIIGGGVIGVEFASIFRTFGAAVTIVEMLPDILNTADTAVIEYTQRLLKKAGVEIICNARVTQIDAEGLVYEKNGSRGRVKATLVLAAGGRVPNTDPVMLDRLGIRHERGRIETDEKMQTSVPGIYAIGDVNGRSMLAHTASREGEAAVDHILGRFSPMDYGQIPCCVYTTPEIAWIGMTEQEASALGIPYQSSTFPMAGNGKSLIEGESDGFIKLLSDLRTGEVLGAHLVCAHATDMIMEVGILMKLEGLAEDIADSVHPHPTVSEAVMEAAAGLAGMAVHI